MSTIFFGTVRPKFLAEKLDTPYFAKIFPVPQFFWKVAGIVTNFFGTVRPNFRRKTVIHPPPPPPFFIRKNFLKPQNFSKTVGMMYKNFRHCETKLSTENCDNPPFQSLKLFETRKFLKNSRTPLKKFSALWDREFSTEQRETPYYAWNFSITKISETFKWCPRKFLALWDREVLT